MDPSLDVYDNVIAFYTDTLPVRFKGIKRESDIATDFMDGDSWEASRLDEMIRDHIDTAAKCRQLRKRMLESRQDEGVIDVLVPNKKEGTRKVPVRLMRDLTVYLRDIGAPMSQLTYKSMMQGCFVPIFTTNDYKYIGYFIHSHYTNPTMRWLICQGLCRKMVEGGVAAGDIETFEKWAR